MHHNTGRQRAWKPSRMLKESKSPVKPFMWRVLREPKNLDTHRLGYYTWMPKKSREEEPQPACSVYRQKTETDSLHLPEAAVVGRSPWQTSCLDLPTGYTASSQKSLALTFSQQPASWGSSLNLSQQTQCFLVDTYIVKEQDKTCHPHLQSRKWYLMTKPLVSLEAKFCVLCWNTAFRRCVCSLKTKDTLGQFFSESTRDV